MVKYLGSKRALLPAILEAVGSVLGAGGGTVLDLFSGTSRVGHALKGQGYRVLANDHNAYAHALGVCYVQADAEEVLGRAEGIVADLNRVAAAAEYGRGGGEAGADWFTRAYCLEARFFHPENGARIYAVREAISRMGLGEELEAVALTALMQAADRVDSTTGLQMAYLKEWAPRAMRRLELRVPRVLPRAGAGKGRAVRMEAAEAARLLGPEAGIAYIDPPYNQHSYLGNYHIWETLVRWDAPEVYGAARKRADCRTRRSAFNSRRGCLGALREVLAALTTPNLIVSFSNEGFISREEMEGVLGERGEVRVVELEYKRYVGAQIGIYNPRGEKVGKVSHLRNTEFLYVVRGGRRLAAEYQEHEEDPRHGNPVEHTSQGCPEHEPGSAAFGEPR